MAANYKVKLVSGKTVERYMADPITARNQAEDMARRNDAWKGSRWTGGGDKFRVGSDGRVASKDWPNGRIEVTDYDITRATDGR